jgi:hypothetical protein
MEADKRLEWILKGVATLVGLLFVFYMFKDTQNSAEEIKQYTKTKDSLEGVIQMYQAEYIILKEHSDRLDSIIKSQTEKVKYIKKNFYIFKTPKINNPDSATKYIQNFIKE